VFVVSSATSTGPANFSRNLKSRGRFGFFSAQPKQVRSKFITKPDGFQTDFSFAPANFSPCVRARLCVLAAAAAAAGRPSWWR
jgi:hypothetical protein